MDKPPYKPHKEKTSLANHSEDDYSDCLHNLILKLSQDLHNNGAEKRIETVRSSSTIPHQIDDIFNSRLYILSKRVENYIEASISKNEQQIENLFDSRLYISSMGVEKYIEASSMKIQQQIEDPSDSMLFIWGRGVGKHIDDEDVASRTVVNNFTNNHMDTFLTICVIWKGCKTSSRKATPLGDPRGVPKFTNCDFQVFNCVFLDCTKVGQLSEGPTVLAYFESKVGSRKGFRLMVTTATSYDKSARLSLNKTDFQLSRLIRELYRARSSLLQGWRFGKRLSAQLKSAKQFLSKWKVLTACSVMLLLATKSKKIPLTKLETLS